MDTIALYILALVEMTVAGAQIIYTSHEVAFFQNLVFYIGIKSGRRQKKIFEGYLVPE
jgi:hypothetical protein